METKAVIRNSTVYEKLDKMEEKIIEVKEWLAEECIDEGGKNYFETLRMVLGLLDRHYGLLLYAKENHNVDLDKILDSYYINERGYKPEEILK